MSYPSDFKYTEDHEWILVEGDEGTVGITDFAQEELGEVVFVELPSVGDTFSAGEEIGTIESVKAASEIYLPVGGEVLAINEELQDNPALINDDPHGGGWLVKIQLSQPPELDRLLDADTYRRKAGD